MGALLKRAYSRGKNTFLFSIFFLLMLLPVSPSVHAQTKPAEFNGSQAFSGNQAVPSGIGKHTQSTVPNKYEDAVGNLYRVDQSASINQQNINHGVRQILSGEYSPLVFQAAEQGQGSEMQKAANNILNGSLGSVNETYKGMHQWFKDDMVGNLFSNIGQLAGKWLTELIDGWIADTVHFLAKVLRIFVLNPNIAVNGLDGNGDDSISKYIRQGADVMYGIAVDLLLLLFILCIWKFWAEASWKGAGNLMGPVGRLIFTAGILLAWPTMYAFEIQISNEMIKAIWFNTPDQVLMLEHTLAQAIKGGLIAAGAGATMVLAPIASKLALGGTAGGLVGGTFYFASSLVFTILGGILITEIIYILVLKAIQTALLTAQYMFGPIFLVFFATPDTESYAVTYVKAFVETSLWTFVWVGLLKVMTIVMYSDFNPWGKVLVAIGVLQLMIQVPTFMGKAQISPASDFLSPEFAMKRITGALNDLRDAGVKWADAKLKNDAGSGSSGATSATNPQLKNTLNQASQTQAKQIQGPSGQGPQSQGPQSAPASPGSAIIAQGPAVKTPNSGQNKDGDNSSENSQMEEPADRSKDLQTYPAGANNTDEKKSAGAAPPSRELNGTGATANTSGNGQTSQINTVAKNVLGKLNSAEKAGLRLNQDKTSISGGMDNGVRGLDIAENATDLDMARAIYAAGFTNNVSTDDKAREAARTAALEANPAGKTIGNHPSKQAMFQQAVKGSQAYVNGEKGNAYTDYLRSQYGAWGAEQDAMATQMVCNPESESTFNRNVAAASQTLIASGLPDGADTLAAAMNPALAGLAPTRRKQAVKAMLAYTQQAAREKYGSDPDFAQKHGELASSLSSEEVNQALLVYQAGGQSDLSSPMAQTYMQTAANLSNSTERDFGTAYQSMVAAAPRTAARLGYIKAGTDLASIASFTDLSAVIQPQFNESPASAMQVILETTGSNLAAMESHRIPMTVAQDKAVSAPVLDFLGAHIGQGSIQAKRAYNAVAKNLGSEGAPVSTQTLEAIYSFGNNGGSVDTMDTAHIILASHAFERYGNSLNPHMIEIARARPDIMSAAAGDIPWSELEKLAVPYTSNLVSDYRISGVVGQLMNNNVSVNKQNVQLAIETSAANSGNFDASQMQAVLRVAESIGSGTASHAIFDTFARSEAARHDFNPTNMDLGDVLGYLQSNHRMTAESLAGRIVQFSRHGGFSSHQLQDPLTVQLLVEQGDAHPYAAQAINVVSSLVGGEAAMEKPGYIQVVQEYLDNDGRMNDLNLTATNAALTLSHLRDEGMKTHPDAWRNVRIDPKIMKTIQQNAGCSMSNGTHLPEDLVQQILQMSNRS